VQLNTTIGYSLSLTPPFFRSGRLYTDRRRLQACPSDNRTSRHSGTEKCSIRRPFRVGYHSSHGILVLGTASQPGRIFGPELWLPTCLEDLLASCPPPCIQANGTYYDWISLVGDILFYTTAAYVGLPYWLRRLNTVQRAKIHRGARRVLAVLALTVIALSAGNYTYDAVYGTGNHWAGYGLLTIDHFSFQQSNLLTVWFRDIGPGTAAISNIYIKNADGSGPTASYPLNLTIDQGALGTISENTTSQGLQLIQDGTYNLQINEGQHREYTFTVTLT